MPIDNLSISLGLVLFFVIGSMIIVLFTTK